MFTDLTPVEQQRVAQAYMPQMGGRSPADVGTMLQMLTTNPGMASQAMTMYNEMGGNNSASGGANAPGSRINDLMSSMMAQDGTTAPATVTAPLPPTRGANVPKQVANAPVPPVKPTEFSGEDRVALAGGPGSSGRTSAPTATPTQTAENSSETSLLLPAVLAALGLRSTMKMPPGTNVPDGGAAIPATNDSAPKQIGMDTAPKQLPPAAGGDVVPAQDRFAAAFGPGEIVDAEFKDVTPKPVTETKKLAGPSEPDTTDKRPKANADEVIEAKDGTKATTAKEKLKPKVRVK